MGLRLELHELLVVILGSRNVYFQPPENVVMKYPAIVYERDKVDTVHADNAPYRSVKGYTVTYIDQDPDSPVPDKIGSLPMSSFSRRFAADGLNHDVYSVYF